jgi:CRP-like cAMP-binding protein
MSLNQWLYLLNIAVISMRESIITYIKKYSAIPLTEADIENIKEVFVPKKIRKRQYFLQEGEVCKNAAFIVKGAMRQYTVDEKGVEHITRLFIENWWVTNRESYATLTPSVYNIDAWEDCDVLLVKRDDFQKLLSSIPAINDMLLKVYENFAIAVQKRVASLSLPAEERYAQLLKSNPEFLQRFPQHIIASYLGVSRETLSRARSQALRK